MTIEVIKPGLLSTVQDDGRRGYYHLGIPPSGAMDQHSFRAANLLLDNPETAAVLECALIGPELRFTQDSHVAVTGAAMVPKLDGVDHATDTVIAVQTGQVLSLSLATAGARAYLAVAGGIDVPQRLGSRSTYAVGALGGLNGRKLEAGDVLPIGEVTATPREGRTLPPDLRIELAKEHVLRMILGLYDYRVTPDSMTTFLADTWTVSSEADRIGYRLKGGTPLTFFDREPPFGAGDDPSNIVDACYPIGSIQVPSGREPIMLHRDAVSGGGYMMLGTVISADMDLIGQMPPNTKVRFEATTLEQALTARAERTRLLDALRALNPKAH